MVPEKFLIVTRNTFSGTLYWPQWTNCSNNNMAGCIAHAWNSHISTSALKSDVAIVFLDPRFPKRRENFGDSHTFKADIGLNICVGFQDFLASNGFWRCKIGEGVVRYWPLTNSFFLLGILTSVPLLMQIIDQEMRPWECLQTDRHNDRVSCSPCWSKPIFTALHGMQTRSSNENSVYPSVPLSVKRMNCEKTEEKSVKIFIQYERSFSLVFWEEWLVVSDPFYLKFWVNRSPLERNRRFSTDNRS